MNIPINKDIEEEYRDQIVNGFTLKEGGVVMLAVLIVIGTAAAAYYLFALSPKYGCYIGIPLAFPVLFFGFKRFQGLTALEYIREIIYERRTKVLAYDAEEVEEDMRPFTLRKEENEKK